LPSIADSLNISVGLAGLIVTALTGAGAVAALVGGPLLDHYGRKRFLVLGVLAMGAASLAFSQSPTFVWLFGTHMIFGACLTLAWVALLSYVGDYFPYERRATAMGVTSVSVGAASMVGALVGLALAETLSWRWAYVLLGILCLLVAAFTQVLVPKLTPTAGQRGFLVSVYATSYGHLLRQRRAASVVLAGGIFFLAFGAFNTYFPAWVAQLFSLSPAGLMPLVVISGMASILGGPISGLAADRFGKTRLVVPTLVLIACLWWVVPTAAWSYAPVLAVFACLSMAVVFAWTSLTTWATSLVADDLRGSLMALHVTAQRVGSALGAAVGAWLLVTRGFDAIALGAGIGAVAVALVLQLWGKVPGIHALARSSVDMQKE
jgi:predicted MFS family arabinose efflux permease